MPYSTDGLCPALPDITNGRISYNLTGQNAFPDSTVATYICNERYLLEGVPYRTCNVVVGASTGEFDGEEPHCIRESLTNLSFAIPY